MNHHTYLVVQWLVYNGHSLGDIELRDPHTFCIFSQRSIHNILPQTS